MTARAHVDYSGTPLWKKLGIKEGTRVLVISAPEGFDLEPPPPAVRFARRTSGPLDVALLFVTRRVELARRFAPLAKAMDPAGRLWVAWPKKASAVETDLTFEVVQGTGLAAGLVDNKSASIDGVFQGLQFVVRSKDRPQR